MASAIHHVSFPFDRPDEILACDEALLERAEESELPGFLRFFEPPNYFMVLGYAKKLSEEIFEEACANRGIPIYRRCSGGGTVLQGPGCFNFSLVLPIDSIPGLDTITGANRVIMQKHRDCLRQLLGKPVEVEGVSDLTIGGVKFSGNAQRRRKRCLLFHGSFLLHFDLSIIPEVLQMPRQQPQYRAGREHLAFVANIGLKPALIKDAFKKIWNATERLDSKDEHKILQSTKDLARTKYSTAEWNRRF